MIFKTINEYEFIQAFDDMGRADNFSVPARRELFDYYEDLTIELDQPFELDVIGICCDWSEYTAQDLIEEYADHDYDPPPHFDTCMEYLLNRLHDETTVIEVEHYNGPNTYLVQSW